MDQLLLQHIQIKLARAATGRNTKTAEHPFYSYDDWFIGSTEFDFGVPREIKNMKNIQT